MFFGLVTLAVALCISAVAAYYSIVGLMAIFSASAVSIAIMGVVLEIGKLVTASWLYQNWTTVPKVLKYYLTSAVVVLMFITSMGIFGYLSKSHIDAGSNTSQVQIKIDRLNNYIKSEQKKSKSIVVLENQSLQNISNFKFYHFLILLIILITALTLITSKKLGLTISESFNFFLILFS